MRGESCRFGAMMAVDYDGRKGNGVLIRLAGRSGHRPLSLPLLGQPRPGQPRSPSDSFNYPHSQGSKRGNRISGNGTHDVADPFQVELMKLPLDGAELIAPCAPDGPPMYALCPSLLPPAVS
jgi:hypothetical protein